MSDEMPEPRRLPILVDECAAILDNVDPTAGNEAARRLQEILNDARRRDSDDCRY